ncbi:MAG: hypothetical protein R2862_09995 [Thermoanaerobaculia bacterium]
MLNGVPPLSRQISAARAAISACVGFAGCAATSTVAAATAFRSAVAAGFATFPRFIDVALLPDFVAAPLFAVALFASALRRRGAAAVFAVAFGPSDADFFGRGARIFVLFVLSLDVFLVAIAFLSLSSWSCTPPGGRSCGAPSRT